MELNETEREIVAWLRREVGGEVTRMQLAAGLPGGTRTQRTKIAAFAEGAGHAVTSLIRAIESGSHRKEG